MLDPFHLLVWWAGCWDQGERGISGIRLPGRKVFLSWLRMFSFSCVRLEGNETTCCRIVRSISLDCLFDPILNFFNVGYWQLGFNESAYPFNTIRVLISFFVIGFSCFFLKRLVESSETLNDKLLWELAERTNRSASKPTMRFINSINSYMPICRT